MATPITTTPNLEGENLANALAKISTNGANASTILAAGKAAIPADSLQAAQQPVVLPTQKVTNTADGIMTGLTTGLTTTPAVPATPPVEPKTAPTSLDSLLQQYLGANVAPPSVADEYAKAKTAAGITEKTQAVNDLTAKLNAVAARSQAAQLTQEGRLATTGSISGEQQNIQRQAAIEALPISVQLKAAQGNLEAAQQDLETSFKLKSEDAKNTYDFQKSQRDAVYQFATDEQKRKLDAQEKKEDRAYDQLKTNTSIAENWAKTALENGQGNIAGKISALDPNSPNFRTQLAQLQASIVPKPDTDFIKLDNGQTVMVDKNTGKILKSLDGQLPNSGNQPVSIPKNAPAEIKNDGNLNNILASGKVGAGTKTYLSTVLGVINSAQDLANANQFEGLSGINPLNTLLNVHIPWTNIGLPFRQTLKKEKTIENEGYINAINLKVQQWASGASLTKQQIDQVEKFTPSINDTDENARTKLSNLTNFMYTQAKSALQSEGIQYEPEKVDLFESYKLYQKASPEQRRQLDELMKK